MSDADTSHVAGGEKNPGELADSDSYEEYKSDDDAIIQNGEEKAPENSTISTEKQIKEVANNDEHLIKSRVISTDAAKQEPGEKKVKKKKKDDEKKKEKTKEKKTKEGKKEKRAKEQHAVLKIENDVTTEASAQLPVKEATVVPVPPETVNVILIAAAADVVETCTKASVAETEKVGVVDDASLLSTRATEKLVKESLDEPSKPQDTVPSEDCTPKADPSPEMAVPSSVTPQSSAPPSSSEVAQPSVPSPTPPSSAPDKQSEATEEPRTNEPNPPTETKSEEVTSSATSDTRATKTTDDSVAQEVEHTKEPVIETSKVADSSAPESSNVEEKPSLVEERPSAETSITAKAPPTEANPALDVSKPALSERELRINEILAHAQKVVEERANCSSKAALAKNLIVRQEKLQERLSGMRHEFTDIDSEIRALKLDAYKTQQRRLQKQHDF